MNVQGASLLKESPMISVLLLSGGLDSAVCLVMLRPHWVLTVDYGQPHATNEIACAEHLVQTCGAKMAHAKITMPSVPIEGDSSMLWPGRNMVLLSLAAALAQQVNANEIIIGANAADHDGYPDCRPEFFAAAEPALGVRITVPLIDMTKPEIGALARDLGVPIGNTWSCYYPSNGQVCGACDACAGRELALA